MGESYEDLETAVARGYDSDSTERAGGGLNDEEEHGYGEASGERKGHGRRGTYESNRLAPPPTWTVEAPDHDSVYDTAGEED